MRGADGKAKNASDRRVGNTVKAIEEEQKLFHPASVEKRKKKEKGKPGLRVIVRWEIVVLTKPGEI